MRRGGDRWLVYLMGGALERQWKERGLAGILSRRSHMPIINVGKRKNLFHEVESVIYTSSSKREKTHNSIHLNNLK